MMHTETDFPSDLRALERDYELIREIGQGGMAAVYLARRRSSGRLVAIKAVRARYLDDQDTIQRFAREARTVAGLDHPNIVRTEAIEQIGDRAVAIIMEHVAGGTVRDRLREYGAFGAEQAEAVLRDVASALGYAHRRGIVHRDVKPENVFLDAARGRALLSDFGIARRIDGDGEAGITLLGSALGTPQYMSPEQIDGGMVDGRSDIYSLGVLGWELLTGRRPWAGESLYGVIYKQKHEDLSPITSLRPRVPANLLFAIEGALAKDRERRWRSTDEFLEQLTYNPPPVLAQAYPAGAAPTDDQPTVQFRRPGLQSVSGEANAGVDVALAAPVVAVPAAAPAPPAEVREPFIGVGYQLPEFGPSSDQPFELDRARSRLVRGLALLVPLAIAGASAFIVLGDSSSGASRQDRAGAVTTSGGSIAGDSVRSFDSAPRVRVVAALDADSAPPTGSASAVTAPPRPDTVASGAARGGDPSRGSARRPVPVGAQARREDGAGGPGGRATREDPPGAIRADANLTRVAGARGVSDLVDAHDGPELEDPFRPPTVPLPAATHVPRDIPADPAGPVPNPRCRLASTADQRVCLAAYVSLGDASMERAFGALVGELRRVARVPSSGADPVTVQRVRIEQRAWLSVRDAECRRQPAPGDNPFWAQEHARCFNEMAAARAKELQEAVRRLQKRK